VGGPKRLKGSSGTIAGRAQRAAGRLGAAEGGEGRVAIDLLIAGFEEDRLAAVAALRHVVGEAE